MGGMGIVATFCLAGMNLMGLNKMGVESCFGSFWSFPSVVEGCCLDRIGDVAVEDCGRGGGIEGSFWGPGVCGRQNCSKGLGLTLRVGGSSLSVLFFFSTSCFSSFDNNV
jgi:hypothetical protein